MIAFLYRVQGKKRMNFVYRKSITYIGWGLFFLSLLSCSEYQQDNVMIQVIDVTTPDKVNFNELFSDCKVIPLETTDSSLIGLTIDKVEYYKGRFYVLNQLQSHKNVICFDSTGRFLFHIDRIGRAPDEYTFLSDFFIDLNKEQLVFVSEAGRYVFLDMNGKYLYDKKTKDFYLPCQVVFNDSNYLVYNDIEEHDKNCDLLVLDTSTMDISRNLENYGEITYNTGGRALSSYRNRILYYHFNDTIYDISMLGERKPVFYINCGNAHIDSKELINRKKKNLTGDELVKFIYSQLSNGQLKFISSILENDRWVIINGKESNKKQAFKSFFVLFDKKNNKSYLSSNIDFGFFDPLNTDMQIIACSDEVIYCLINKELSSNEKEAINKSNDLLPQDKMALKQREESDNPFLLRLK